ncbi:MAG: FIST C-terminal domain-containing protein [Bacteroidota bacterium]
MYHSDCDNAAILRQIDALFIPEGQTLMLLFGEKSGTDFPTLIKALAARGHSFFGGIFPGIIDGDRHHDRGYLLKSLPLLRPPLLLRGLDSADFQGPELSRALAPLREAATLLTFVDGLAANIAPYLSALYQHFSPTTRFLGGGAGSLTLRQGPCLFTEAGLVQDAALIAAVDWEVGLGVQHGWHQLRGPLVATRTERNVIYELNWENAFEAYARVVNAQSEENIRPENFFSIAKGFPFGIFREKGEDLVRDPVAVGEAGEIICVGEIPENAVLYILEGEPDLLIQAAQGATQHCLREAPETIHDTLVVDCISRALFLQQDFTAELRAINAPLTTAHPNLRAQGVLSLGEISSYREGYLEFYNKTLVLGLWH